LRRFITYRICLPQLWRGHSCLRRRTRLDACTWVMSVQTSVDTHIPQPDSIVTVFPEDVLTWVPSSNTRTLSASAPGLRDSTACTSRRQCPIGPGCCLALLGRILQESRAAGGWRRHWPHSSPAPVLIYPPRPSSPSAQCPLLSGAWRGVEDRLGRYRRGPATAATPRIPMRGSRPVRQRGLFELSLPPARAPVRMRSHAGCSSPPAEIVLERQAAVAELRSIGSARRSRAAGRGRAGLRRPALIAWAESPPVLAPGRQSSPPRFSLAIRFAVPIGRGSL
jgi:hypothetical protein